MDRPLQTISKANQTVMVNTALPDVVQLYDDLLQKYGEIAVTKTPESFGLPKAPLFPSIKYINATFRYGVTASFEFRAAREMLEELRGFDKATLAALAKCSELHFRRMSRRRFFAWTPKVFVGLAALFGIPKVLNEVFGFRVINIFAQVPGNTFTLIFFLLALGVATLFLSLRLSGKIYAMDRLDDIIAIAKAHADAGGATKDITSLTPEQSEHSESTQRR
jgi:hypothetical protein